MKTSKTMGGLTFVPSLPGGGTFLLQTNNDNGGGSPANNGQLNGVNFQVHQYPTTNRIGQVYELVEGGQEVFVLNESSVVCLNANGGIPLQTTLKVNDPPKVNGGGRKIVKNVASKKKMIQLRPKTLMPQYAQIPLAPKTPIRTIQPRVVNTVVHNENNIHQMVYVLQSSGEQTNGMDNVTNEKLQLLSKAVTSKVTNQAENKNVSLGSEGTKTKIIYRVINPEDLNLGPQSEEKDASFDETSSNPLKNILKKHSKNKLICDLVSSQVTSVTRSGRCVRPPRHIVDNYDKNMMENEPKEISHESTAKESNKNSLRSRLTCPVCRKAYRSSKRMGHHFHMFPDHAINAKCKEVLTNYTTEIEARKHRSIDVETQTDFASRDSNSIPSIKNIFGNTQKTNDPNLGFNKYHREISDRSLLKGFLRLLQRTSPECRASVFLRQLTLLTIKLRKLVPCLLQRTNDGTTYEINEPVSKILDLNPGKYQLNMDAIACAKLPHGMCAHMQNVVSDTEPLNTRNASNTSWPTEQPKQKLNENAITNSMDKWSTDGTKPKWIPIGSNNSLDESSHQNQDTWMTTCDVLVNNSTFNEKQAKSWESSEINDENAKSSSWIPDTMSDLSKMDISQELNDPSQGGIRASTASNSINFNCKDKLVDLHNDLALDIPKEILPLDMENDQSCNGTSKQPVTEGFDFNDSDFNMQTFSNTDKLNFSNAQYNDLKYSRDILPPFRKIDNTKTLQLPVVDTLNADGGKLHIASGDPVLGDNNFPIAVESRQELLESTRHLDIPMNVVSDTLTSNESILNVNDSSLDGPRLNISASQCVLNLLDPLGADCLSFSDGDLNPRTSQMALDLQLDLFPFHHS